MKNVKFKSVKNTVKNERKQYKATQIQIKKRKKSKQEYLGMRNKYVNNILNENSWSRLESYKT